jgi:ketopantoate reductase
MAKIAVVGCGAMGSVYALMVDAGHEVHAVTLWPDHAEAMASQGLRCEGASGDRTGGRREVAVAGAIVPHAVPCGEVFDSHRLDNTVIHVPHITHERAHRFS